MYKTKTSRILSFMLAVIICAVSVCAGTSLITPSHAAVSRMSYVNRFVTRMTGFGYTTTVRKDSGRFLDISKYQGNVNFGKLKNSGVSGVIMRASYGTTPDSRFSENAAKAEAAGVEYGVYQFATWHYGTNKLQAMFQAQQQALYLISQLSGKSVNGFVVLDMELERGAELKMSKADLTDVCNYYLRLIARAGYKPMLYTFASFLTDRLNAESINYPMWIAYIYPSANGVIPNTAYGKVLKSLGNKLFFWQYTWSGNGKNYGISGRVDTNYLYRSFTGKRGLV